MLDQENERQKPGNFANNPSNFVMDAPYRLIRPEYIEMGDDVYLGPNAMLNCITKYPSDVMQAPEGVEAKTYTPKIKIGNRVSATGGLQIGCCEQVTIEDDVLFASNVHMTDAFHGYDNVDVSYKFQPMWRNAPIHIGKGSWIGQNCVIAPGVTIGRMCIIGANSVVSRDIPDYSIAVGTPAKVTKVWNADAQDWVSP